MNNCKFLPIEGNYFNYGCIICNKDNPKYKCPNCYNKYCGINCNKEHKNICKTKLFTRKKIRHMNVKDLKKDLNFLSEIINKTNKVKKKLNIIEKNCKKQNELQRFKILKINSKKRGIDLEFFPNLFDRHRNNISFYFTKEKIIYWNIELIFIINEKEHHKLLINPKNENLLLSDILNDDEVRDLIINNNDLLNFFKSKDSYSKIDKFAFMNNTLIYDRLKNYDFTNFDINNDYIEYLKNNIDEKIIKIPLIFKLKDILICQKITEYPTIYINFDKNMNMNELKLIN